MRPCSRLRSRSAKLLVTDSIAAYSLDSVPDKASVVVEKCASAGIYLEEDNM